MSIEVVGKVLWAEGLNPTEKLVLIGLANHAHPDGTSAFPSVKTLATYAGVTERSVQRYLRTLEDGGLIETTEQASAQRPTTYRIVLAVIRGRGDNLTPLEETTPVSGRGDTDVAGGVTPMSQRGDIALSPEPSVTVKREPSGTTLAPKTAARERDLLYEELFFVDTGLVYDEETRKTLTETAAGELNKATRQVKATGIDPLELSAAIMAWPQVFPGATATASAIAKHLPRLRAGARGQVARSNGDSVESVTAQVMAKMKQQDEEGLSWVP